MSNPTNIAMLLDGPIRYDARVTRIAKALAEKHNVDLFYIHPTDLDKKLFEHSNVNLIPVQPDSGFHSKLNHFFFIHRKFAFFYDAVLRSGKNYHVIHANDYPTLDVAAKIAKKLNARLVYDAHEIYLETINQF